MEWSDPDDAWGDERGNDPADARAYPPAPVPAHERAWRHPSEIGQYANQAWAAAEPPVALGRGLLVATSMVGCALGVAILWLLVPAGGDAPTADFAGADRPAAVATRPTQPAAADRSDGAVSTTSGAPGTTFASLAPTTVRPPTTPAGSPGATGTLPGEDPPANTVLMAHEEAAPAVAVLLGDSPFLVTTANAVGDLAEIEITFVGGDVGTATVVSVDDAVAYLSTDDAASEPLGFADLDQPTAGATVYALGNEVVSFSYGDTSALAAAPDDALAEGTPVVDDRGALVGLCTHAASGWAVVTLAPPPATDPPITTTSAPDAGSSTTATTDPATPPTAYLGVALGLDDTGHVSVLSVTAGSPADLAGIIAGQRILAVDGIPLSSPAELVATVRGHAPGDAIELTVSSSTAPVASTVPRDSYAAPSTTLVVASNPASTTAAAAPPSTASGPSTTATATSTTASTTPTSSGTSGTSGTSTSTASTTIVPTTTVPYGMPTYTVTVVLGERAPTV